MNPFMRFVISVDPKNTRSNPTTIKKAPTNGFKKSADYFPGIIKSLQASGPEICTEEAQSPSFVTEVAVAS